MKKQGFTLIELMVVIVIMGILAAVAVPKLFGMIAKSKASEVGPAAGTYVKLQDAYFAETNSLGKWDAIGYKMANTTNFTYGGENVNPSNDCSEGTTWSATDKACKGTKDGVAVTGTVTGSVIIEGWTAANGANLNDCAKGTNWKISATTVDPTGGANATGASLTYSSAPLTAGCTALTPKFVEIAPAAAN